jgi:serine/threonine-protein kinase HipA
MFDVYLYDVRVGVLSPRGRGVRFGYVRQALDDERLPALSLSLPKQQEQFPDSQAGPFFRNLLPEQAYRRLVATAVGTAPENNLALLGAIGGECPGAVSIWPAGSAPPRRPEYEPLNTPRLMALFSPADRQPLANGVTRGRLSLAGAQEKIALMRDAAGNWHLPLKGAVTSHILKQAMPEFNHILENELCCTELARRCGLPVPPAGVAAPEVRVFCAERFDRPPSPTGEPPRRKLHQEDFCQVLRFGPELKYETDGGPSLKKCAAVVRRHSALPAEDLMGLVRWVGFNYLIGNEDAHAKNLALLYLPDGLRLAPHYDLVSTEVYPNLERRMAMKIGRAWDVRNVHRTDWRRFADHVDLPWQRVRTTLLELSARLSPAVPVALAITRDLFGRSPIYEEISHVVGRQTLALERALSAQ